MYFHCIKSPIITALYMFIDDSPLRQLIDLRLDSLRTLVSNDFFDT